MNFTISINTGNIEQDVWSTILNFNEEQTENFIKAVKLKKDNDNIVGAPIFFRYPECEKLLSSIEDATKLSIDVRKKIRTGTYRLDIENILTNLDNLENVKSILMLNIIAKFKNKINIQKEFSEVISNDRYDSNFYNLCFKIISSDEYFNKFLNFSENQNLFGNNHTQKDYILELSKLLGYQEKDICQRNPIYKYHFITEDMKNRYYQLRKIINVDIEMLGSEIFNQNERTSYSKEYQQQIDNDWEVNPKLITYIMQDMDPDYNELEQISHIYIKLCQALRYNLGYHIKKWSTEYNKERQESITPENNEIICSEFSITATNIINKLYKDIEARCIITGKEQHLAFGIFDKSKNIRINFDSTKIENEFDDLARVKIGLPLNGVIYICDRNDEFKTAFEKVYQRLCQSNRVETKDLIDIYDKLRAKQEIKIDFIENISEFSSRMKKQNIVGSELLAAFKRLLEQGYFGKITYAIVGEDKKSTFFERQKLATPKEILDGLEVNLIIKNENDYYLLKLNEGEIIKMNPDDLNQLFDEDKMAYFNPKYRIEGIGVKSCMKA